MWRLEKDVGFEAAHFLPHHDGKCRRMHGHSFRATLVLVADSLLTEGPKVGMVQDFGDVSVAVRSLLDDYLDHHTLNDTTGLENPTSEELARWIFDQLKPRLPLLKEVTVQETCTSQATYQP